MQYQKDYIFILKLNLLKIIIIQNDPALQSAPQIINY